MGRWQRVARVVPLGLVALFVIAAGLRVSVVRSAGAQIAGTVVDAHGVAVPGVTVAACDPNYDCPDTAVTAANGTYAITGLSAGVQYWLQVQPPDGSLFLAGWFAAGQAGSYATSWDLKSAVIASDTSDASFTIANGYAVSGTILGLDALGGSSSAPVAADTGVEVCAAGSCAWAMTDAAGHYTAGPVPSGSARVNVGASGRHLGGWYSAGAPGNWRASYLDSTPVAIPGASVDGIDVVLPVGSSIAGVVTGPDANPVPDAAVIACSITADNCGQATTDAAGAFVVEGLPDDTYRVAITPPEGSSSVKGYYADAPDSSNFAPSESGATAIAVQASAISGIAVTLPEGRFITGIVLRHDGSPAEYAWVTAIAVADPGSGNAFEGSAGRDGSISVGPLPSGDYLLRVYAPSDADVTGWFASGAPGQVAARAASATAITVAAGDAAIGAMTLQPAGSISGVLTDSTGNPIPWAIVFASSERDGYGELGRMGQTDETGSFTVSALAMGERYYLQVRGVAAEGYAPGFYLDGALGSYTPDRDLATGILVDGDVHGIDLALQPGGSISGVVTGPDAATPVAFAQVTMCDVETAPSSARSAPAENAFCTSLQTDAAGRFSTPAGSLPDLAYTVEVQRPHGSSVRSGYYFRDPADPSVTFTPTYATATPVVVSANPTEVNITLPAGMSIRGRVTYADGSPVTSGSGYTCSGAFVFTDASAGPSALATPMDTSAGGECAFATWHGDGTFVISGLESGDFKVTLFDLGSARAAAATSSTQRATSAASAALGIWYCSGELVRYWSESCTVRVAAEDVQLATVTFESRDAAPPVVAVPVLDPALAVAGSPVALVASAVDDGAVAGAEAKVGGDAWAALSAADGSFGGASESLVGSVTAPVVAGDYAICVRASDAAGNVSDGSSCATLTVVPPRLEVAMAGAGSGSVGSSPAGISCGAVCDASFAHGTAVALTATAAPGSMFKGWSGVCSGAATSCVVAMTANQAATARFEPVPTITSVSPVSGSVGTSVVVTGTNLAGVAEVRFSGGATGVPAVFTVMSPTSILTSVPGGAASGPIRATAVGGTASSAVFTISGKAKAPTVASFSPTSGIVGDNVTISGTNLAGAKSVKVGSVTVYSGWTVKSASQLVVPIPAGATSGTVAVSTDGGVGTGGGTLTVITPPVVSTVAPSSSQAGTSVTISGSGLGAVTSVTFGGVAANFTVVSSTSVTATVPSGLAPGPTTMRVINRAGSAALAFTVSARFATTLAYTGPATAAKGVKVTLTARLTATTSGGPLQGFVVSFTFNGKVVTAITSASGAAAVSVTAPKTAGAYPVALSFAGTLVYEPATASGKLTVN